MSGDAGEAAVEILIQHQRDTADKCACGWGEWGQSHAAHVIHELQMAGLDVVWR